MRREVRPWLNMDTAQLSRLAKRGLTLREIAERMDRDRSVIAARAERHGIEVARVCLKRPWTAAEVAELTRRYPDETATVIARDMGRSCAQVHNKAQKLGLVKSEAFKAEQARIQSERARTDPRLIATQIKPGTPSWNKGTKGVMGQHPNSIRTQFKKGRPASEAHNYQPVGTERYDVKRGVVIRKITDDPNVYPAARWQPVHRIVWEAAHGPVPPGHVAVFKPGMKTLRSEEITADRVEIVTNAELMHRNSVQRLPPELRQVVQLTGALKRKINNRNRKREEQDQRRP